MCPASAVAGSFILPVNRGSHPQGPKNSLQQDLVQRDPYPLASADFNTFLKSEKNSRRQRNLFLKVEFHAAIR